MIVFNVHHNTFKTILHMHTPKKAPLFFFILSFKSRKQIFISFTWKIDSFHSLTVKSEVAGGAVG